jgi:hypothetical protein
MKKKSFSYSVQSDQNLLNCGMPFCGSCGGQNNDGLRFCGSCGGPMQASSVGSISPGGANPAVLAMMMQQQQMVILKFASIKYVAWKKPYYSIHKLNRI